MEYNTIDLNLLINQDYDEIKQYLKFNGINKFDNNDINILSKVIPFIDENNRKQFNVSYVIERLDKEFDLIKINAENIVNLELKSSKCDLKQCELNYEILHTEYPTANINVFCYEGKTDEIYEFSYEEKKLILSTFSYFNDCLNRINDGAKMDININVDPIYTNPNYFFEDKYCLSVAQQNAKDKIIISDKKIFIVSGRAGSGKSLLALDLYKHYKYNNKSVVYLAAFKINDIACKEVIGYANIQTIRSFLKLKDSAEIIVVDEAQRITKQDFRLLKERARESLILIGDINQNIDGTETFKELYLSKEEFEKVNINQIIRSDDTFEIFARKILNIPTNGIKNKRINKSKIEIEIQKDISNVRSEGYTYIEPSKSLYFDKCEKKCVHRSCNEIAKKCKQEKTAYKVVGTEYDQVLMFLCDGYSIVTGELTCNSDMCYGNFKNQIYLIMTRTVKKLKIIVSNIKIYNFLKEKLENL